MAAKHRLLASIVCVQPATGSTPFSKALGTTELSRITVWRVSDKCPPLISPGPTTRSREATARTTVLFLYLFMEHLDVGKCFARTPRISGSDLAIRPY